jgi:undecaprenyl-diphosphatase
MWLCLRRIPAVSAVMRIATRIGDGYVWIVAGLGLLAFSPRGPSVGKGLAIAYALELTAYRILKSKVTRSRPFVDVPEVTMGIVPPDEFSFPSGHTAAAFVFALVVGVSFPVMAPLLFLLAVLIAVSRVYFGVHYPTDVLAGAALGTASGAIGIAF